jgi:uncharacterized membrane protein YphA (DoxX/SURF4 family)
MFRLNQQQQIHYTLRIASAMCFIGHGAFGIITKPIWCNYFGVVGIGHSLAYHLMPIVGTIDILFGAMILFYPVKVFPFWLIIWGLITASMRPLSGEPFAEMIERAGNFGAPLALLILSSDGRKIYSGLFKNINPQVQVNAQTWKKLVLCLQVVVFLLLAGHGWLNLLGKKSLLAQYTGLGFSNPANTAIIVGIFEVAAACMVLIKPLRPILIVFLIWKMTSELFYPQYEVFEWVERGGSYGCLLALIFALDAVPAFQSRKFQMLVD